MESVKKACNTLYMGATQEDKVLTTSSGTPIQNGSYSLTAGATGPALLQDTDLIDRLQHFDREQIPPRNVHALGTGAYGTFTVTNKDMAKYSIANLFSKVDQKTDIFVRFSGVFTGQHEAETVRDLRGLAIKFYTNEGNWDLLTINTPVFSVRDTKVGPDAIHAFKRDPRTGEWNSNSIWDFVANHVEALQQTLMIFTDRDGTPTSFRNMNCFGCNTFSFINEKNEVFWVKFHIRSHLPPSGLDVHTAKLIAGEDPDFLRRDLRNAIESENFPKWTLSVQVMPEERGLKYPWTFDCTKAWSHSEYPLIDVGTIELNRNPVDFHAEVEQVAFSPSNVVPGIGFSPDRLLQGRLFLYSDTQFHRLGSNYKQIPINLPHVPVVTHYVGGHHQMEYGVSKFPTYSPSCFGGPQMQTKCPLAPVAPCSPEGAYHAFPLEGTDEDYFQQCRDFLEQLSESDMRHLAYNIAISLVKVQDMIVTRIFPLLDQVSNAFRLRVEEYMLDIRKEKTTAMDPLKGTKVLRDIVHNLQQNKFVTVE